MKRTIATLTIAILTLASTCYAQGGLEWRVRAGFNNSSLIGVENTRPALGFYAGAGVGYLFTDHIGITLDATYSQQGTRCNADDKGVAVDYYFDYLNLPLLFNWRFGLGGTTFRLIAGPQLGLFLNGKMSYAAPSVSGAGSVSGTQKLNKKSFHPADFGLATGLQWELWKERLMLEVRYTMGITQTHDGISNTMDGYYYISVPDNRNSVLQVGITALF